MPVVSITSSRARVLRKSNFSWASIHARLNKNMCTHDESECVLVPRHKSHTQRYITSVPHTVHVRSFQHAARLALYLRHAFFDQVFHEHLEDLG